MHPGDQEKTSFMASRGTYCYKVMPFSLKNAGSTYQRVVNMMFADQIGLTMEVYIDDMLVKSLKVEDHISHLQQAFSTLRKYSMKLNPAKCMFGVSSGKFLGCIMTHRGIEANPKQILAIPSIPSPRNVKEVQRLARRMAALSRFISRLSDKSNAFFETLKNPKDFQWMEKCESVLREQTAPTGAVQPVGEAAQTLADYNRPDQFYINRSAIRPLAIQRGDFELKPQYYTLVGQTPYCGLSNEHPMDHLERFEDLISIIQANGVPVDYLLCKLFKHSLSGEALQWLKQLPPGSLTSWSDIKNAFLRNFFDDARAEDLRRKIATFNQEPGESFKDTWIRFKSYQRDCPHHGFNKVQLLCTFFRGIALKYQMALDTASEGNFTTRNPENAVKLIDNLASSNNTKNIVKTRSAAFLGKEQINEVQGVPSRTDLPGRPFCWRPHRPSARARTDLPVISTC
ncbi:hypothetical protein Bca101_059412 [Brassica carinata]